MFRISGISRAEYLGVANIVMLLCAPWFMGTAQAKDAKSLLREGRVCLTLAPQAEHDMRAYTYACNYMKDTCGGSSRRESCLSGQREAMRWHDRHGQRCLSKRHADARMVD